ncbi:MAG: tRNA 2-thiocytidine biosynthesis TtcA family protein [Treponema sp.]|jgi:tRNA 2-thiocytidine biosynthesis protein TtcA|nr:tRNA 2-thiocytidine biosynthesis TtcA family protein [Treponema sp.]
MAHRFFRTAKATDIVEKLVTKLVYEHAIIEEGDRILIAVSGGKDSTILAWALSKIRPTLKRNYTLTAIHISSDFCACCKKSALEQRLNAWDIPFVDRFVPIIGRLKTGKSMNCYWCSTQRRLELLNYATEHHFNKLALGHHLDDIIETFFMNLTIKGTFSTMALSMPYRNYPVRIIRPLAYLEEQQIIACAAEQHILNNMCTCPYGMRSERRVMRARIANFTHNSSAVKRHILHALLNSPVFAGNNKESQG